MLVRLRDFAEINRVSERTVQLHVKENWEELQTHIDRRGKQGTWLDDYAQEFLLKVIQLPSKDEVVIPSPREAALLIKLTEATNALAEAERRASLNAEAAGKVTLLEAANESQQTQINKLTFNNGKLEYELQVEQKAHAADNAAKDAEIAESQKRETELRERAEAAEAKLAEFESLPRWKKIFWKG